MIFVICVWVEIIWKFIWDVEVDVCDLCFVGCVFCMFLV